MNHTMTELQREARMGALGTVTTEREVRRIDLSNFGHRRAQITDELWAEDRMHPDIVFEATEIPTLEGLVAAGFGVAVVPVPRDDGDSKVVHVPLTNVGAKREVGVVWDRNRALSPAQERFVTFLKAVAG